MQLDLPARALFDCCVPVRRRAAPITIDGDLSDWSDDFRLPDLSAIEGASGFAAVYAAWDARGLYFALDVREKASVTANRQRPVAGNALLLFVDTRDVRDALRAGRFCHHFLALPRGGGPGRRAATAWQAPIRHAREQAPMSDPSQLTVASVIHQSPLGRGRTGFSLSYSLELALPAAVLHGYDPDECSRLGLTYLVTDVDHGAQLWNVPPGLPFEHDPSTWAAIELVD